MSASSSPTFRKNTNLELEMGGNVVNVNTGRNQFHLHHPMMGPLPGRPRRWKKKRTNRYSRYHHHHHSTMSILLRNIRRILSSLLERCHTQKSSSSSVYTPTLGFAILAWYTLGVLSISTSKLLLSSTSTIHRISPMTLTFQQFFIGMTLLRILIAVQECYSYSHQHKHPPNNNNMYDYLEQQQQPIPQSSQSSYPIKKKDSFLFKNSETISSSSTSTSSNAVFLLWKASACFALGFFATNLGFAGSEASFVETLKAAEPITSAAVAVAYQLETINTPQQISLGTIVMGVLLSTCSSHSSNRNNHTTILQTRSQSFMAGGIVMISNLCFSFRGLYQKLFRKQEIVVMDDLNLQYRMQQMGVALFIVPVLLQHLLFSSSLSTTTMMENSGPNASSYMSYWLLALVNGCAFTCYNLASTYILSRISVVHHAAINCIRRVFAIVVTSILFGVPITLGGGIGIALAVVGFMSYTHFKILQQQSKQPPTSTTTIPSHPQELLPPVSSLLPVSAHANNQHRHYHYK